MYWSRVRHNRFGFVIIHAVGIQKLRMLGHHQEEHFYSMFCKEGWNVIFQKKNNAINNADVWFINFTI